MMWFDLNGLEKVITKAAISFDDLLVQRSASLVSSRD